MIVFSGVGCLSGPGCLVLRVESVTQDKVQLVYVHDSTEQICFSHEPFILKAF